MANPVYITPADIQQIVSHWLSTRPYGYLSPPQ